MCDMNIFSIKIPRLQMTSDRHQSSTAGFIFRMLSQYNKNHSEIFFIKIEVICPLFECIVSITSSDIKVFIKLLIFFKRHKLNSAC